eukprot:CAMPEP_0184486764 /NCGR_PEP_ID=MMETSP0113_2-20130426/8561_1 /TAXON_ID=91329 /ORGANISM="Norrisiella sphaerica, Strain BC52" /LENGTH=463 /DNA_ID=CAMNT_0026868795 /DNA_START=22 /DNA_END=1413 /DNA_ORIENTATION=+
MTSFRPRATALQLQGESGLAARPMYGSYEARRQQLYRLNSPLPSGYGSISPKAEIGQGNKTGLRFRNVPIVEGIGQFSPAQSQRTGSGSDSIPESSHKHEFSAELGQNDLLSPVGSSSLPSSLFPVLPSFDSQPSEDQSWKATSLGKEFPKCESTVQNCFDGANKEQKAGIQSPSITQNDPSVDPPKLRRYVSIPKIHLQFDDNDKNKQERSLNEDELRAMNEDVDNAIFGGIGPNLEKLQNQNKRQRQFEEEDEQEEAEEAEEIKSPPADAFQTGEKRPRPQPKMFACGSCRVSKTKCEGGFPCVRCERLGKECKKEEKPSNKRQKVSEDVPTKARMATPAPTNGTSASYKAFAKQIFDLYSQTAPAIALATPALPIASIPQVTQGKSVKNLSAKKPDTDEPTPTHCYRNSWCIRPYRHPGHCKHADHKEHKKRLRRAKQNRERDLAWPQQNQHIHTLQPSI